MKTLKKLLEQRAKAVAELERVHRLETETREKLEKFMSDRTDPELSEQDQKEASMLRTKLDCCPGCVRTLQARISGFDVELRKEFVEVAMQLSKQARADEEALVNKLVTALLPFFKGERDAIEGARRVIQQTHSYRKIHAVSGSASYSANRVRIDNEHQPIHQLAQQLVDAEVAARAL